MSQKWLDFTSQFYAIICIIPCLRKTKLFWLKSVKNLYFQKKNSWNLIKCKVSINILDKKWNKILKNERKMYSPWQNLSWISTRLKVLHQCLLCFLGKSFNFKKMLKLDKKLRKLWLFLYHVPFAQFESKNALRCHHRAPINQRFLVACPQPP